MTEALQGDADLPAAPARVAVAMSGGVDSSVAAALVARTGREAVGLTMQLYDHGAAIARKGACCAGADIADARRAAQALGIPHYVLDYEDRFRAAVMDDFADAYLAGATPIPCIRCNERVKFRDLLELSRELGAACLVTGHYVRRVEGAEGPELHRAADPARDQSYFLFTTTRAQLADLRFPLGGMADKGEVRALAARFGLGVADKPDSQDICFVPDGDYAATIERLRPEAAAPGEIVDLKGRVLGRHEGVLRYTIGQRRGLGIASSEPLYVVRLDARARRVVVGPRSALGRDRMAVGAINWLGPGALADAPAEGWAVEAKVRSTRPPAPARVLPLGEGRAEVVLETPEDGVAPGQACVWYEPGGTRVLGGGWIERTL